MGIHFIFYLFVFIYAYRFLILLVLLLVLVSHNSCGSCGHVIFYFIWDVPEIHQGMCALVM